MFCWGQPSCYEKPKSERRSNAAAGIDWRLGSGALHECLLLKLGLSLGKGRRGSWGTFAIIDKLCFRRLGRVGGKGRRRNAEAHFFAEEDWHTMAEHVTETDVRAIAEYACIGLTAQEVVSMTADLNAIIESLAPITEFDLEGVPPTFHPIGDLSNVMRDDVETPGFSQQEALMNAPKQEDGCFLVPSILGEGGDR